GNFLTLSEVNEASYDSGHSDQFEADDYDFPYLESWYQLNRSNSISWTVEFWELHYRLAAMSRTIAVLNSIHSQVIDRDFQNELERLKTDLALTEPGDCLQEIRERAIVWADALSMTWFEDDQKSNERILFNPSNHTISDSEFELAGLAFGNSDSSRRSYRKSEPSVLLETTDGELPVLRNEFFEVRVDPATGGVRSVNRHAKKGNLFSQQVACRFSHPVMQHGMRRQKSHYANIVVDQIDSLDSSSVVGSIHANGKLLDQNNQVIARFKQTTTVERHSPVIKFRVSFELEDPLKGSPWRNYLGSRIAWADEDALLVRSENEIGIPVYQEKFTAPSFIEIRNETCKITLLPGGLPFHRRSSRRMLDSLMVVEREKRLENTFGIAIDVPSSMGAAVSYQMPMTTVGVDPLGSELGGWIFHLSSKNILVTDVSGLVNDGKSIRGIRMRLQETEGRSGKLRISCPFEINSAARTNLLGEKVFDMELDGDSASCEFLGFQFFQIEMTW
ncbi:MAG: hypothetical protein AAGA30_18340, partial [Planctomycetota bacterium]